jgi:hypothetical protein
MGCRGVGPGVAKGPKAGTLFGDRSQDVQKIARRPRQSIELCYQEHVTRAELRENAAELDAIAPRSTGRLAPDLLRACRTQGGRPCRPRHIDPAVPDVGQQALQRGALGRATGIAAVVVSSSANRRRGGLATTTYDNNGGNLLTYKASGTATSTFTWDYRNRMTQSVVAGATTTYGYDINDERVLAGSTIYPFSFYLPCDEKRCRDQASPRCTHSSARRLGLDRWLLGCTVSIHAPARGATPRRRPIPKAPGNPAMSRVPSRSQPR